MTLSEEELLSLGRSLVLQVDLGERIVETLSRNKERAVHWFLALAGEDAPKGVPRIRRGL